MAIFGNKEEREARRDEKQRRHAEARAERQRREDAADAQIERKFKEAEAAADSADIHAEELAIREAMLLAEQRGNMFSAAQRATKKRVAELIKAGRIRRSQHIATFADVLIREDRIVDYQECGPRSTQKPVIRLVDEHTHAEVMTEGQLRTTTRPTLTRMAAGSVLPGTALIPGLALQKDEKVDDRRAFLTIEQRDWAKIIEFDPKKLDPAEVRQLAARINSAAGAIAVTKEAFAVGEQRKGDALDALKKLGELRDAGVLTEDEFMRKKAKLLDDI